MEEFVKYRSLRNHNHEKDVNYILYTQNEIDKDWVSMEKMDGANFSFLVKDNTIYCASRTQILDHKDDNVSFFRDWRSTRSKYIPAFREVLCQYGMDVQVFGELVGRGIQGNIYELEDRDFYVFDIRVGDKFLSHDEVVRTCKHVGFKHVPIFEYGKLIDLLKADNLFESSLFLEDVDLYEVGDVYKKYKNDTGKRIAEGLVLKPIREYNYFDRPTIKSKNNFSSERVPKKKKQVVTLSENDTLHLNNILELINLNRVNSVISKIGTPKSNEFGKVKGLTIQDALEEFKTLYEDFGLDDKKAFMKKVDHECTMLLRSNWINIFED